MNEINTKPEDTKICLKCKKGLRSGQHKCNFCGCKDFMSIKKYYELTNRYEQANDEIKDQIKNNPNYELFFKYQHTQTEEPIQENKINCDEFGDTIKSVGSLITLVIGIILWIYLTINVNSIIGLIVAVCFILLDFKILSSISNKTKQETARIIKEQKEQKEYQELHGGYKCPNCGEHAGHEISTMKKAVSVGMLGLASDKIGKNYECKNCGYKW